MDNTNRARGVTLSLAALVLFCFFLPWVQLSCVGIKDSVSGFDLARENDRALWLVPLFMLLILGLGFFRLAQEKIPALFALAGTVGGGISAYLMYHEHLSLTDAPRLVAAQWTVIFWLSLLASLGIVATAFWFYSHKARAP